MAINYRDPRFQRAMLSANADPRMNSRGIQQDITGKFAAQQQDVLNKFNALAIDQQRFDNSMSLRRRAYRYSNNMFKRRLNDAQAASNQGIVLGLGTSLIAGLIGRDRRLKEEALGLQNQTALINEIKKMNDFQDRMEEKYNNA